jgi:iron complex outermembrane receptor protein
MSPKSSSVLTATLIVALAAALPLGTYAAEASDTLEEVVVTAEKHEESAQKTAISMNVYNGEQLLSAGVTDVQTLTRVDPSINFTSSTGAAYVSVRGVASTDLTETGDPAVAVSRDGFFTNRSWGLFASMYDVARVEVLKGPQGTLYGRNTAGGVVNIISQLPTKEFGGYAAVNAGEYGTLDAEGAINLPLSDAVQLRVSAFSGYHKGYRSLGDFGDGDDADNRSGRVQLAFQPWSGFSGLIAAQHDSQRGSGDVALSIAQGTSGAFADPALPQATPAVPYGSYKGWDLAAPFGVRMDDTRFRWNFSQQLPGGLSLTYLGGYDKVRWQHALDGTAYPKSANPIAQFLQEENPTTWNHELRLASAPDARLFWQVGGFYFKEDNSPLHSGLFYQSGPFANQYFIDFHYAVHTTSEAGFGQLAFKLNDQWKLSAGARYTRDHKERTGYAVLDLTMASGGFLWQDTTVDPFAPIPVFLCTPACTDFLITTPGNGDITNSRWTYHLGLDWTPTDHTLVYAKFDTGYKAGGFNSNGSAPSVNYEPETVNSIEVGTKNRLLDDRLQANLSLFDMRYKGYQASQFTQAISGNSSGVFNAGDADIYGAEGEIVWLAAAETRLNLNATLLHAKFSSGCAVDASITYPTDALGQPVPACGSYIDGNYLPNSPTFSARAGIEQGFVDGAGGHWTARLGGKYQSSYYFSIFNHPDVQQRAYVLGDIGLGYAPASAQWEVEAYLHNFTDEVVLANAQRNALVAANNYQFQPPRVAGLRVSAHF